MLQQRRLVDHGFDHRQPPPLCKSFGRAIALDEPSTPRLSTIIGSIFSRVMRAVERGDSGPAIFNLLPQFLNRQFDHRDAASALSALQDYRVPSGTPYSACYRAFRIVDLEVTGSKLALALGMGLVLEVVRLSVNEQFPQLMLSLYPGELTTCPLPFWIDRCYVVGLRGPR